MSCSRKPPHQLSSEKDYAELLEKFDTWLFDCDGVLWHGMTLIDGALEVLQLLRAKKKKIIFVTNNASTSRSNYMKKFNQLGIEAHLDEIFGSAYAAAVYLSSVVKFPKDKKVFLIGMEGLEEELRNEGITFVCGTDPKYNSLSPLATPPRPDPSIGTILCGFDYAINYTKLSAAFVQLDADPSCLFVVTNEDPTAPSEGGVLLPAGGAISAPLRYALGKDPVCVGKPSLVMLDCIKAKHEFDPSRTIIAGDRLSTDILFGKRCELATLLVLTGVNKESDLLPQASPCAIPDFVTQSIGDLLQAAKI
ncbi:4-nitrophenylphosphatase [Fomitiporia mediterranea MF3/22]|uniref:4-nitrophenylphosphatase n=1 Tax=Fomitiporia mediterranea (strain MF3/22) TaxID=694068 RepID=UPI0004407F4A|nr:4-nitrophenylphosphatase [Fomitiporia mediterranea MF3/22]EJD01816.1 4-nitrophenylphosphatase [Fomitiporia mediterranea MF3/22]